MSERATQSWLRRAGTGAVAVGMILGVIGAMANTASADHGPKVTICHATNSNVNPYVTFTVDSAGVDGLVPPQGDHFHGHTGPVWNPTLKAARIGWGDIIPPVEGHHAGLNWDAAGQAIWNNGCAPLVAVATANVTLAKVTTGANDPVAGTWFPFTVVCESGTVPASPVQIASGANAVTVATGVGVADSCTITETDALGAASTVLSVDGVAQPAGTQVVVTVSSANDVVVVATNDFPVLRPVTGDVTLSKVTTGVNAPAVATPFTFTILCQSGTVPASPVQVASGAAPVAVATGVTVGDTCTITETAALGAASTVFTVGGVAQPAGAQVVVTVTSANGVAVLATNDFPAAAGPGPLLIPPVELTPPVVTPPVVTPPQAIPVVLPNVVEAEAPVVPETPAEAPTKVEGVVVTRAELPRTGSTTLPLLQVGLGLILLGAAAVLFGRERTALI